ncbi:hypothetical protein AAC387_Pa09g0755 [Persea americana]
MPSLVLFVLLHLDRRITQVREQEMHGRSENFRRLVDFRSEVLNKEIKGLKREEEEDKAFAVQRAISESSVPQP